MTIATAMPATTGAAPGHLAGVASRITARLDELLAVETRRWVAVDPDLADPLDTLRRLTLSGGKRLRPAFCEWGYRAAGAELGDEAGIDALDRIGVAFELLHAFALVHDDVMDGSDRRRGEPTAHVEHAGRHRAGGWRGETRRFGESAAILVGDLAHVLAGRVMADQPPTVRSCWHELETELMMGQYLDVLGTARGDRSAAKARLILQMKSGRYTIERPLQIGAALAASRSGPVDVAVLDVLAGYGRPLGEAFQLRDDLLGVFGEPATTGKPVGDDLREGKPTLLLAFALDHADARQRALLDRVGDHLDDAVVADLLQVLVDTGARRHVEDTVEALTDEAVGALAGARIDGDVRRGMTDLAHHLAHRSS